MDESSEPPPARVTFSTMSLSVESALLAEHRHAGVRSSSGIVVHRPEAKYVAT